MAKNSNVVHLSGKAVSKPSRKRIDLGKPTIDLLLATKAVVERDLAQGFITEERLRFTIEARKEEAKKLRAKGLSVRQIAKVTGVSKSSVASDLSVHKPDGKRPETGQSKTATPKTLSRCLAHVRRTISEVWHELSLEERLCLFSEIRAELDDLERKIHENNSPRQPS